MEERKKREKRERRKESKVKLRRERRKGEKPAKRREGFGEDRTRKEFRNGYPVHLFLYTLSVPPSFSSDVSHSHTCSLADTLTRTERLILAPGTHAHTLTHTLYITLTHLHTYTHTLEHTHTLGCNDSPSHSPWLFLECSNT